MDVTMEDNKRINEFSLHQGKHFTCLTLRTYDTNLVVHDGLLTIEMDKYYLGFFKGKKTTLNIPLSSLVTAETITTGFNTGVILTTNTGKDIKIPSNNKKDTKNFINFINDLYIEQ